MIYIKPNEWIRISYPKYDRACSQIHFLLNCALFCNSLKYCLAPSNQKDGLVSIYQLGLSKSATMKKCEKKPVVLDPDFKNAFPGIFNFTVGILNEALFLDASIQK